MEAAGYNGLDMARRLGWSGARVSRLLAGKRGGALQDVAAFATSCGLKGPEYDRLLALTEELTKAGWLQRHGANLPAQVRTLIGHEDAATDISSFQYNLVPGLLQTSEYAREVIAHNVNVPADEVEDRVSARLRRQQIFNRRKRPVFTFYLHEFALRLPVGGAAVMSEQLHHLLRMSVRPYNTLRLVTAGLGAHAGMSGPFTLMDVAQFKEVVYLDSETSSVFLEEPVEITAYRNILTSLDARALDEGQSRETIAVLATELYGEGT